MKYILYQEKNQKNLKRPPEDSHANSENIFIVADGITIDPLENGSYLSPSPSGEVANVICKECLRFLEKIKTPSTKDIKESLQWVSKKVERYNKSLPQYEEELEGAYNIGSALVAIGIIQNGRLIYGILDDCYVSVFSDDLVDRPKLKSYVKETAKFYDANYDYSKPQDRKFFRQTLRNNAYKHGGKVYGYGAIDGSKGFEPYLQLGEVALKENDLVCVYTDGFIKPLADKEFVRRLKSTPLTQKTKEFIKNYCLDKNLFKEKTGYFIKCRQ